jgi:hypothetical protein
LSYCPLHGYLKGKIRIKKALDGKYFAVKTLKLIPDSETDFIKKRQENIQMKRRLRRRKQNLET